MSLDSAGQRTLRLLLIAVLALALGLLAGCGSDDDSPDEAGSDVDASTLVRDDFVGNWIPADGTEGINIELQDEGTVSGTDGCNQIFGGQWDLDTEVSPPMITLEAVGGTLMACTDAVTWPLGGSDLPIEGDELIVRGDRGQEVGRLVRAGGD